MGPKEQVLHSRLSPHLCTRYDLSGRVAVSLYIYAQFVSLRNKICVI